MKKCNNCNVAVYDSEELCPLCFESLGTQSETFVEYPKYKKLVSEKKPLKNSPLFISVTSIIISIYINIFTHEAGSILWSIIATSAILFCLGMFYIISENMRLAQKMFYGYLLLSALLLTIDFSTGMLFWSTDFVFPFLTVAMLILYTILAVRSKRYFSEYFGFILAVTLISFLPIGTFLLGFNTNVWGAFVAVITCVVVAMGLYLFADKALKDEIKKRFHR